MFPSSKPGQTPNPRADGDDDGGASSAQGPSTDALESLAKLNLQRVYQQSRRGAPKRDGSRTTEPTAPPITKGKPRLLLMGQKR
jgi:hypothetical protein